VGSVTAGVPFEVQWADADPAGWIYFANVWRYIDAAEGALMAKAGVFYTEEMKRGRGYPRVRAEADFKRPLEIYDRGICHASVGSIGRTSIRLDFALVKDGDDGPAVTAAITMVVLDWAARKPIAVPADLRERLDAPAGS
jgi:acyl-CoA thioesterase FadM